MDTVWGVDDDRSIRWVLEKALKGANMDVRTFENADGVLRALDRSQPDVITLLEEIQHARLRRCLVQGRGFYLFDQAGFFVGADRGIYGGASHEILPRRIQ